nr:protein-glutamate O-methyltransferase CheR [Curvibacter sp. CHRR-16]
MQLTDNAFQRLVHVMYRAAGLSFSENKRFLVQSRLAGRIQQLGLDSFEAYADVLCGPHAHGEMQAALDLLTTNETYFFREPEHFQVLEQHVTRWGHKRALRVWSAACSYGDEPYSIAMLLMDLQVSGKTSSGWSIVATDISHRVLLAAKEGIYPQDRLRAVSEDRLRRYCLRGDGQSDGLVMVQEKLRQHVQFGQLNLCQPLDTDWGLFDAIFLRNVLIYFDAPTKQEVADRVLQTLRPGGLFFVGTAEGRVVCRTPLDVVRPGVFRKKEAA